MAAVRTDTEIGEVFLGKPKTVSRERLWAFSGGPFKAANWPAKNIHTDLEHAVASGMPSRVAASGSQFQGYVIQLMIDLFGVDWLSHGTMDVRFVRIVSWGDTLTARAVVRSKQQAGGATQFVMDVDCRNAQGEAVMVGVATGGLGSGLRIEASEFDRRLDEARAVCTRQAAPDAKMDSLTYTVTAELNQQFLYAEEDFHARYIEGTGSELPIVHPALIVNWSNDTRSPSYSAPSLGSSRPMWATLHTREQTFFYSPARVGSTLTVTWTPLGSYDKRGRQYSVSLISVVDQLGTCIIKRLYYTTRVSPQYPVKA